MKHAKIIGAGFYVPEGRILNDYFATLELFTPKSPEPEDGIRGKMTAEKIFEVTGIRERRKSREDEFVSDLGTEAAKKALEDAKVEAGSVDGIIFATMTADRGGLPPTANIVQENLGCKNAKHVFDYGGACSGFVSALDTAGRYLATGAQKMLVIGADTMTKIADYTRSDCILWSDGAGAVVLEPTDKDEGIMASYSHNDPFSGLLYLVFRGLSEKRSPGGGFNQGYYRMPNGTQVMKYAKESMSKAIEKILEQSKWNKEEVLYIIQQQNLRTVRDVCGIIGIDPQAMQEKVHINLDMYGVTSTGSCAIAFAEAKLEGKIKEGTKVIMVGSGAGEQTHALGIQF